MDQKFQEPLQDGKPMVQQNYQITALRTWTHHHLKTCHHCHHIPKIRGLSKMHCHSPLPKATIMIQQQFFLTTITLETVTSAATIPPMRSVPALLVQNENDNTDSDDSQHDDCTFDNHHDCQCFYIHYDKLSQKVVAMVLTIASAVPCTPKSMGVLCFGRILWFEVGSCSRVASTTFKTSDCHACQGTPFTGTNKFLRFEWSMFLHSPSSSSDIIPMEDCSCILNTHAGGMSWKCMKKMWQPLVKHQHGSCHFMFLLSKYILKRWCNIVAMAFLVLLLWLWSDWTHFTCQHCCTGSYIQHW